MDLRKLADNAKEAQRDLLLSLDLTMESERLKSFQNWPIETNLIQPEDLARSGFFFLGQLDRVQCFSCDLVMGTWQYGAVVDNAHRHNSPMCKMVRGIEAKNLPIRVETLAHFAPLPATIVNAEEPENQVKNARTAAAVLDAQVTTKLVSSNNISYFSPPSKLSKLNQAETTFNKQIESDPVDPFSEDELESSANTSNQPSTSAGTERLVVKESNIKKIFVDSIYNDNRTIYQSGSATSPDMNELIPELQNKLTEQARSAASDVGLLKNVCPSITPVSLEITTNLKQAYEDPDDIGHGHRRADFLTILDQPEGDVLMQDLFQRAKSQAETEAPQEPESREIYLRNHGNCVGVIGQAGIGKTTLTKMFTKVVLDESILQHDYIFYIPIRNVNFETTQPNLQPKNVLEFLVTSSGCELAHTEESDKEILKRLESNPNVVLVLDGLDEAPIDWSKHSPKVSMYKSATAEAFLKNLLNGKIFPQARKIVTSRPRQFHDMHEDYKPEFIVNIMGLKKESQKSLCRKLCGSDSEKVLGYLGNHPSLFAYCYVPVNCIITMYCIQRSLQEYVSASLDSITSILAFALERFRRTPHIREVAPSWSRFGAFRSLCRLAWNGFRNRQIIFDEDDLREVHIDKEMLNAFLRTDINIENEGDFRLRIFDGDKRSYFSHLIWHEMFVAVEIMLFMPLDEFRAQMPNFALNRWENVTKFMYGISNAKTMVYLRTIFLKKRETPVDPAEKKNLLNYFALQCLPALMENDSTPALLRVFDWANECQNMELRNAITEKLPREIRIRGTLHSNDVSNLTYIFQATNKPHIIKAGFGFSMVRFRVEESSRCFFQKIEETLTMKPNLKLTVLKVIGSEISEAGMESLCRCLNNVEDLVIFPSNLTFYHVQMLAVALRRLAIPKTSVSLTFNDDAEQGARALASCMDCMERLNIRFSEISSEGYAAMSQAIQTRERPMKQLNFRGNVISERGALALSSCLSNVDSINFEGNEICGPGAEHIAAAIQSRDHPVELLKLSRNRISDRGGIAISNCVRNVHRLQLLGCSLTFVGVSSIARSVQQLENPIELLELSANVLGDQGVLSLTSCLAKVKTLLLVNCSITPAHAKTLADALRLLDQPMKNLDLGFNQIGDEGMEAMSTCLNNIELLNVAHCGMTTIGVQSLCTAVDQLSNHSIKLVLDMNDICNNGAEILSSSLNNIKRLSLWRCGITESGAVWLSDGLDSLEFPMEELNLSENQFNNSGAIAISRSLKKVKSLYISSCGVTSTGALELGKELLLLNEPMERLKLNGNKIGDEGGRALSTCLSKVKSLDITQCGINEEGSKAMAASIKSFPFDASGVIGLYAQ
ncbi:unnamed protein product [Clavelina lepadiformis]|uniref:NACHT domain-containing protein n=2 Tax=Clavelina lepadiformis TaxID=159417 RepID=A0ABP0GGH9_CLALP